MVMGIIGLLIMGWAFKAGIAQENYDRAEIFMGPIGTLVNLAIISLGATLAINGLI